MRLEDALQVLKSGCSEADIEEWRSAGMREEGGFGEDRYCHFFREGICIIIEGNLANIRAKTVVLFPTGYMEYTAATDTGLGISFGAPRASVRAILGEPEASGGGQVTPLSGAVPKWDRFARDGLKIVVHYTEDSVLQRVAFLANLQ